MAFLHRYFVLFLLASVAVSQTPPPQSAGAMNSDCFDALGIAIQGDRPASNRAADIQEQREDFEYVLLSRHHIIPYATMRDFYNNLLMRDLRAFQRLFNDVIYVAAQNVGLILSMAVLNPNQYRLPDLPQLAGTHLRIRTVSQVQLTQEVYAWLPFNIYIGPSPRDRDDDAQANAFDDTARSFIGNARSNLMMALYHEIVDYNSNPNAVEADTIINTMGDLVHLYLLPCEFNPSHWRVRRDINAYRFVIATDAVRNDPNYRELRPDDYCNTDGQAAYNRYRQRFGDDLKKRSIGSPSSPTKCIMRNTKNDTFCINTLNALRNSIISGKMMLQNNENTVTITINSNSILSTNNYSIQSNDIESAPPLPLDTSPKLTPAGWFLHIITFGSWPL